MRTGRPLLLKHAGGDAAHQETPRDRPAARADDHDGRTLALGDVHDRAPRIPDRPTPDPRGQPLDTPRRVESGRAGTLDAVGSDRLRRRRRLAELACARGPVFAIAQRRDVHNERGTRPEQLAGRLDAGLRTRRAVVADHNRAIRGHVPPTVHTADKQHRSAGQIHDRVRHASHRRVDPRQATRTDHDHRCLTLISEPDDIEAEPAFAALENGLRAPAGCCDQRHALGRHGLGDAGPDRVEHLDNLGHHDPGAPPRSRGARERHT